MNWLTSSTLTCVCTLVGLPGLSSAAPPMYTVDDLGPGRANAIDNNGAVVGWYSGRAVVWGDYWRGGGPVDLGTLGGDTAEAYDINDLGQVVGWAKTDIGQMHAFGWTQAEGMVDLAVSDTHESCALGINNGGAVVGWYAGYSVGFAMAWDGSEPTPLGHLGGFDGAAHDVNELSQTVGWSNTVDGVAHAFAWTQAEGMQDMMPTSGLNESQALAVNNSGAVVGWYASYSIGFSMAWDKGEPTPLGNLGGTASEAWGINDLDQVVGWAETESGAHHAFFWTESDGMVDLNDRLSEPVPWVLKVAKDINEDGWIAVTAVDPDTDAERALVLVPVADGIPTVSAWGMVVMTSAVVAAGTLVLMRRRPARA